MTEFVHRSEHRTEKKAKNNFEKVIFKLMNNSVFKEENSRKRRDIKLLKTDRRESHLVSEPNYHKTKRFSEKLFAIEMNKQMAKPEYLGLSILDISKIAMHEYWYGYIKPKYVNKRKLCYTDTDSSIVNIKQEDVYADLAGYVEMKFDTYNYEFERPPPIAKNKKVIGLMKNEFGRRIVRPNM